MPKQNPSVSVWVQQLQAGEHDLPAEKLWERYFGRLVGLARAKLGGSPRRVADEEDVALSAFDSFCQGAARGQFPQLSDRNNLWRLLVTITARKVYQLRLSAGRQKRGGNRILDEAALAGRPGDDSAALGIEQFIATEPTPEFAAQAAEEYRKLLASLPEESLREVVQWKMEGFTNEEIATKQGCAPRTIERRLNLIRSLWTNLDVP
jgi:DNA-directed RNA polymerase specialized sigma24 family protein